MNARETLPFLALILLLLTVIAVVLSSVLATLMPAQSEVMALFLYMLGSATLVLAIVYVLLWRQVIQQFRSLRWTLLTVILITVGFVLANVYISSQLMLLNEQDVLLISALLLFGGVVAMVAALLVSGALIARIRQLGAGLKYLAQGELDARLPVNGRDELAELGHMFNQMMSELALVEAKKRQLEQTRRDLIAWASHDLRAPLAALRAMNEAILDGVVQDEQTAARYRQSMQCEIEHMGHLIGDLFDLAEMDADTTPLVRKPVRLDALVEEAIEGVRARIQQAGITLRTDLARSLPTLELASDKIVRALHNLLDNAFQHTPAGGDIMVSLRAADDGIEVAVRNSGSFIPPDYLPQVFEPFYRGDSARTPRTDGQRSAGLGLTIARGFIEVHGGRIRVSSDAETGTTFTLWLPASAGCPRQAG